MGTIALLDLTFIWVRLVVEELHGYSIKSKGWYLLYWHSVQTLEPDREEIDTMKSGVLLMTAS